MSLGQIIKTTCPRDCYDGCGVAAVVRDGVVQKIVGDKDHPVSRGTLCGKCALAYNGVWRDRSARLSTPLRRVGSKGEGRFESISWDDALAELADKLNAITRQHGPQTILHTHYTGTCSALAGEFPMRFFNYLGATEVEPDTICNNAGHVGLETVLGSSLIGFDPKTAVDSACIVVWGANPSSSAPHFHKFWLNESPAKVVVVDPIAHETARQADIHVQLRPGTDAAFAFALLYVMLTESLLDRAFLAEHTIGWEEIEPLVSECTPQWAAEICGLSADVIVEVARLYARGPSLLWLGQGLQRQPLGGNVMRACAVLPAASGNIGKPGAGLFYLNGAGPRNLDADYVARPDLRTAPTSSVSHMDLVELLGDTNMARALISWNMNVAASGPRQRELRTELTRPDLFTVVVELFQTDTCDFADIVLPAASFLEFDDLVTPYFSYTLSAQAKVDEPPGEALPNQEIFRRLARAMGLEHPALFESDRAILDNLLSGSGLDITFGQLKKAGTIDPWTKPLVVFEDHDYATPSGHVEIASASAEQQGLPRTPLPLYDSQPPVGQYRLLSPASLWQMNDSYGNEPHIIRKLGPAEVVLHPDDAAEAQLKDGQLVEMGNACGTLRVNLRLSEEVRPGVALSHKGRWANIEANGANVNVLNDGQRTDMGESSAVHGTLVEIRAV